MDTTRMTPETKKQAEELIRIGCTALCHGKPLEEVANIAQTGLAVIAELNAVETPAKTTRKKS
jgi:K+/H+ antiporter YhaU regulatory subunit KhtT